MRLHLFLRHLRHKLEGQESGAEKSYCGTTHIRMAQKAYYGVIAFYTVNLFFAYQTMYTLMDAYGRPEAGKLAIEPFWPVFFVTSDTVSVYATILSLFYMGASLLVVLWPHSRILRCAVCVALVQTTAFKYSFGVLNEKEQWWMWTAFIFIFLPNYKLTKMLSSIRHRQDYLQVFSFAQGMALLFYSLIGCWKLFHGFTGLFLQQGLGMFRANALSNIVAARVITNHGPSWMGTFITYHPGLADIAFIFISYVEFFALVIWFRPSLHRLWGALLILLHIATWLFMNIVFYLQPPLLAIMLIHSPFMRESHSWKKVLCQLPLAASCIALTRKILYKAFPQ